MTVWKKELEYQKIATQPNCSGCGYPAVYGTVKTFNRIGFQQYTPTPCWPKTFLKKVEHVSLYRKYATYGSVFFTINGTEYSAYSFFRDERKVTARSLDSGCAFTEECALELDIEMVPHDDSGPDPAGECPIADTSLLFGASDIDPTWVDHVDACGRDFSSNLIISSSFSCGSPSCAGGGGECAGNESDSCCDHDQILEATRDEEWVLIKDCVFGQSFCEKTTSITERFNGFVLEEEETFAVLAARASGSLGCTNFWGSTPFVTDTFLYPLGQGDYNPWDCRPCDGFSPCADQPASLGVGIYHPQGIFKGQEQAGCVRFHWGITGVATGPNMRSRAAKYRIVIPYDAALPATQLDVTWQIVRRANKGSIYTTLEQYTNADPESADPGEQEGDDAYEIPGTPAVGSTATEIWRRTTELPVASEMDAPQDFLGSLHGADISWDSLGWKIEPGTLEVTGQPGAQQEETRAMYKFVVLGATSGSVTWDVQHLDDQGTVTSTEAKSAALETSGETPVQFLQSARVVNVSVTVDSIAQARIEGAGGWMLYTKERTGLWGFAELSDPSDPPKFYSKRLTTYEHEINGGTGACEGCPPSILQLHETEETTEQLVAGKIVSVVTQDTSTDGTITLRWGREVYADPAPGNPATKASGRPDWFYPKGCHNPNPMYSAPTPDPYVDTSPAATKTKVVVEETNTMIDRRICGALLPAEPDPKGAILGTENKAAVTTNEEDSVSLARLPAVSSGGEQCVDYGHPSGGGGTTFVADQAARLALKLWDGISDPDLSGCPDGVMVGAKIKQESDNTFWEVIPSSETGLDPAPCETLTAEYWRQLRYKTTGEQSMHTTHGDCTFWIENIVATRCM